MPVKRPQPPGAVQLTMSINQSLLDRMTNEAERRLVGRRRLIEAAVREWLERHENDEVPA